MAELNCLNCIAYDDDGNLSAVIDPDAPIQCDDGGRLGWIPAEDIKPDFRNTALLLEAPTENNGLGYGPGGQLVYGKRPKIGYDLGDAGATPLATAAVHDWGTTVNVPSNPTCHPSISNVTVTTLHRARTTTTDQFVYFKQQGILGVGVGLLGEVWRRRFSTQFGWHETHSQAFQISQGANAPAQSLPLIYQIESNAPVILNSWFICWQASTISIKGCLP